MAMTLDDLIIIFVFSAAIAASIGILLSLIFTALVIVGAVYVLRGIVVGSKFVIWRLSLLPTWRAITLKSLRSAVILGWRAGIRSSRVCRCGRMGSGLLLCTCSQVWTKRQER